MTLRRILAHPVSLGIGLAAVHLWLGWLGFQAPNGPFGDVEGVYRYWVSLGQATGTWVGLDTAWVYPILALPPMIAAAALGLDNYPVTWLVLVLLVDAAALAVLLFVAARGDRWQRESIRLTGWWWLGLLTALGPVAVGRIDAITVALAYSGLLALSRWPAATGVLLAAATWTKVWPAALVAAVLVTGPRRIRVLLGAVAATVVVAGGAALLGGAPRLFSFVFEQTGRGLQVEAVSATPLLWAALAGGDYQVYFDRDLITFQVAGDGVPAIAATATPVLALVAAALLAVALIGVRRGTRSSELLPPLLLALTVGLIVFNKVGSPQFVTWLAVPIGYGLVVAARGGPSFAVPAWLALAIAGLTQAVYPFLYDGLLNLAVMPLLLLTVRNVLYVALLLWAVIELVRSATGRRRADPLAE